MKYITAMPRMQLYMDYSAKIYGIYLRYVSKEDIHVYSVDECFIDITNYLQLYHLTAKEMAVKLMQAVMEKLVSLQLQVWEPICILLRSQWIS